MRMCHLIWYSQLMRRLSEAAITSTSFSNIGGRCSRKRMALLALRGARRSRFGCSRKSCSRLSSSETEEAERNERYKSHKEILICRMSVRKNEIDTNIWLCCFTELYMISYSSFETCPEVNFLKGGVKTIMI